MGERKDGGCKKGYREKAASGAGVESAFEHLLSMCQLKRTVNRH